MTDSTLPGGGARSARGGLRRAGLILGGVLGAFLALYGVSLAVTGAGVPRGTEVVGVDIGGRSVAAAQARLAEALPRVLPEALTVVVGQTRLTRPVAELGLGVDAAATADRARDGWASPLRSVPALFGLEHTVDLVPAVEVAALADAVAGISEEVGVAVVEGALTFETGVPVAVPPKKGTGLDLPAAQAAIARAYLAGADEVALALVERRPAVGAQAVAAALAGIGQAAVSGPVTIKVAKDTVELDPARFGPFLSTVPAGGELRLRVDAEGLVENLTTDVAELGRPPRDARFKISGDEISVVAGKPGVSFDVDLLGDRIAEALVGGGARVVDAGARTADPEFTTADAEALGITEKLSSFETRYPYAAYRVTNIGRAAELINGSIVEPGEIWSLNETLGERTVKNGFVRGYIIRAGLFVEDLGGGVSQSATTTYNAAFFAGLKDIEHHPHSLYISRYPAGREATVAWGSKDLRFENDSGHGVYIQAEHEVGSIRVTMWGTEVWDEVRSISSPRRNFTDPATVKSEDPDCDPQSPVDGFDITVTRVFERDGEEVKRESYDIHYDPTDRVVCVEAKDEKKGKDKDGKGDKGDGGAGDPGEDSATPGPSPCPSGPQSCPSAAPTATPQGRASDAGPRRP